MKIERDQNVQNVQKCSETFRNVWKECGKSVKGWNNAYDKGCIEGEGMLRRDSMHNYMLRADPCISPQ
jgi:hypothetical protein